jgi:succinate dehydrogenase/fumarate reductase flavoprotein subunit
VSQLKAGDLATMSVSAGPDAPLRMREAIEAEGQTRLCELMARAALERRESRGGFFGGHYRLDYPTLDNENWLKNIVLSNNGGDIRVSHEAPVEIDMSSQVRDIIATHWRPPNDPAHFAESE